MAETKNIGEIVDKIGNFIEEAQFTEPAWVNRKRQVIENYRDLLEFLVEKDLVVARKPCPDGVVQYPAPRVAK
jgi:hypothetical protein